ncbi:protein of unknown function [Chryseobacterium sp. JV274]|nr:DUF2071 domain-containing protein [Chryseobacterium sp. JV274]CAD0219992.1 protein of unknown function [Chryseobacterium sp. JV274]
MNFLKAEWRKLAIINYEIDPEILLPYLPKGTELDFYKGRCYVSLVGFMFLNTKLLGLPIPFHRNFEEVNLRFYVKKKERSLEKRCGIYQRNCSQTCIELCRQYFVQRKLSHNANEKPDS